MIEQYIDAISSTLAGVLGLCTRMAWPLAVLLGLIAVAGALVLAFRRDNPWMQRVDLPRCLTNAAACAAVGLLLVTGWTVLERLEPLARQDILWRESAEATANPVPDAPPVYQYGPAVAALSERTYTRTLTVPPQFVERVGTDGVGVLAPYLSDPSAENVLRLVDSFRRSGRDVIFTRQVTRLDEEPIPISSSQVRVRFQRLPGRAFDTEFEGRYAFQNSAAQPINARFLFSLPQAGTVRDLNVSVAGQAVPEPNQSGGYEWTGQLAPGERREALVRYRVLGARQWHYDIGSRRRRVEQFRLDAAGAGQARFMRGSLQPTSSSEAKGAGGALRWDLANVVTAQQVALSFPPDMARRESYLQALSTLPASYVLFLLAAAALGLAFRDLPGPGRLALALAIFGSGLGASWIVANYLGPVAGVILAPLAGAGLAAVAIGRRALLAAIPAALLPAAFLSPHHTGLLVLLLGIASAGALLAARTKWSRSRPA